MNGNGTNWRDFVCLDGSAGGTLAKIVYFERREAPDHRKRPRSLSHDLAAGEMTKFVTENEVFGQSGVQDVRLRVHSKNLQGVRAGSKWRSRGVYAMEMKS